VDQYKKGAFFSYEFVGENSWNGYERNCLFANVGGGQFMDVARPTGSDCIKDSRGVAVADYNGDGRLDIVINNNDSTPTIYLNNLKRVGKCIEMKLVGTDSNRDAIGARVRLSVGAKTLTRQVEAGSGFASEAMLPIHFGLGNATRIDWVEISWPSGLTQRLDGARLDPFIDRMVQIEEGSERIAEVAPMHAKARPIASTHQTKRNTL
jgi:enediyne biosynthesis protein E4